MKLEEIYNYYSDESNGEDIYPFELKYWKLTTSERLDINNQTTGDCLMTVFNFDSKIEIIARLRNETEITTCSTLPDTPGECFDMFVNIIEAFLEEKSRRLDILLDGIEYYRM